MPGSGLKTGFSVLWQTGSGDIIDTASENLVEVLSGIFPFFICNKLKRGNLMRIFNSKERLHTSLDTIPYFFDAEYGFYSRNNVREFMFGDNRPRKSLYKRLNIQLVVTNACPYSCSFCVEKVNPTNVDEVFDPEAQKRSLKELIQSMRVGSLEPTVSITGGEPCLYPKHIVKTSIMLDMMGVPYNLNTSGFHADVYTLRHFHRINLSVHHQDPLENSRVFGDERGDYWNQEVFQDATIQKVVLDTDLDKITGFVDSFKQKRISLRLPSRTEQCTPPDWKPLFDAISHDSRFEFIQQKIGDYYFFEEYKYKDKTIRFSYSDLVQLAYYKKNRETNPHNTFVRAAIIMADGSVKFDWVS